MAQRHQESSLVDAIGARESTARVTEQSAFELVITAAATVVRRMEAERGDPWFGSPVKSPRSVRDLPQAWPHTRVPDRDPPTPQRAGPAR
jgi:hypothetical protein